MDRGDKLARAGLRAWVVLVENDEAPLVLRKINEFDCRYAFNHGRGL